MKRVEVEIQDDTEFVTDSFGRRPLVNDDLERMFGDSSVAVDGDHEVLVPSDVGVDRHSDQCLGRPVEFDPRQRRHGQTLERLEQYQQLTDVAVIVVDKCVVRNWKPEHLTGGRLKHNTTKIPPAYWLFVTT